MIYRFDHDVTSGGMGALGSGDPRRRTLVLEHRPFEHVAVPMIYWSASGGCRLRGELVDAGVRPARMRARWVPERNGPVAEPFTRAHVAASGSQRVHGALGERQK